MAVYTLWNSEKMLENIHHKKPINSSTLKLLEIFHIWIQERL